MKAVERPRGIVAQTGISVPFRTGRYAQIVAQCVDLGLGHHARMIVLVARER